MIIQMMGSRAGGHRSIGGQAVDSLRIRARAVRRHGSAPRTQGAWRGEDSLAVAMGPRGGGGGGGGS